MSDKPMTTRSDEEAKEPTTLDEEEDIEALAEPPDWLPDGWSMEVYRTKDGTINRYYTSPISKERGAKNMLQRQHEWLPKGWVMEIRDGGEKIDKMYKFYVHSATNVRLLSKQDVLLYINEAKVSGCDTCEQCDTSSEDSILANVDLWPSGLPKGWVRELVYRKSKEGLIRKDPYYTDPASSYTFRTLKCALSFLETVKVSRHAFVQKTSVHDLYSFETSTNLPEVLRNRLIVHEKPCQDPTSSSQSRRAPKIEHDQFIDQYGDTSSGSDSPNHDSEEESTTSKKAAGKKSTSSRNIVSRTSGRPP